MQIFRWTILRFFNWTFFDFSSDFFYAFVLHFWVISIAFTPQKGLLLKWNRLQDSKRKGLMAEWEDLLVRVREVNGSNPVVGNYFCTRKEKFI